MTTDTPRTDLKELELSEVGYPQDFYALGDLCRDLEREIAESKAEVEEWATKYCEMEAACADHMAKNAKLRELCERAIDDAARRTRPKATNRRRNRIAAQRTNGSYELNQTDK